jgi:hypothetical protein
MRQHGISLAVASPVVTVERVVERQVKVPMPCVWCDRFETNATGIIDELLGYHRVSDWERQFLNSIRQQVARGRRLSDKQIDILKRIAEERGV